MEDQDMTMEEYVQHDTEKALRNAVFYDDALSLESGFSLEPTIVGKILLDRPLSYSLTAIADVPIVYLQQFRRTVSKVHDTEDTIIFKLDSQEIVYTVDIFRDTLHLLVGTLKNPFVAPVIIQTIEAFMNRVGYQGVVDKVSAFYTKNLAQACQTMFKVFNRCLTTRTSEHDQTKINILQLFHVMINRTNVDYAALLWIDEDYNSIKDDIPLVSVYTTRNVLVRGMLILDEFLIEEIHATNDYKEYEMVFMNVVVLMNKPQPVVSTHGTHRTTPSAHRTPTLTDASPHGKKRKQRPRETISPRKPLKVTIRQKKQSTPLIPPPSDDRERDEVAEATILSLTLHKTALAAEAQENIAKVQEKLDEEDIEKMVEGDEDEESYESEFSDSMINDDVDDSGTRIEPGSHKEHPENVNDDDKEIEKEMKDDEIKTEEKNDDVEKTDEVVKEKDNDEGASGSVKFRNEKKQTPIPTPTRSSRIDLSSDKTIFEELTTIVSPTTATTSKDSSIPKRKKRFFFIQDEGLKKAIAAQPKMYDGEMLHSAKLKIDSPDSKETLEDKVNRRSPKENILQNEIDRLLEVSLTSEIRDCVLLSVEKQNIELLKDKLEKSSSDSKDIQAKFTQENQNS
ncbi:hypothetical protein Tco_0840119 [Tanacetum coccineum]|uniref:Uncharacterized protein n=1 Tax=Tanacetum coccineum TaxID=301880 RepID=A0ABQ5AV33_9ASTR